MQGLWNIALFIDERTIIKLSSVFLTSAPFSLLEVCCLLRNCNIIIMLYIVILFYSSLKDFIIVHIYVFQWEN